MVVMISVDYTESPKWPTFSGTFNAKVMECGDARRQTVRLISHLQWAVDNTGQGS